jgi:HD-like signal output (HDOD) protein
LSQNRLQLPSMPFVALEGLELLASAPANAPALASLLSRDPLIAARLLKLANGNEPQVDTLAAAVDRLGLEQVRRLLLELSTAQAHLSQNTAIRRSFRGLWEHCWVVGLLAEELSCALGAGASEATYLAGLLHDLGRLIAAALLLEAERKTPEGGEPWMSHSVWLRVIDDAHQDIARAVLAQWSLPPAVVEGIAAAGAYDDRAGARGRGNLVRFANAVAERERTSVTGWGADQAIEAVMRGRALLGVTPALEARLVNSVRARVTAVTRESAPSRDSLQRAAVDPTLRERPAVPAARVITLPMPAV